MAPGLPHPRTLPEGTRRRTAGLRREEVAQLAGISADYYARIEQCRGPHPSESIVSALAFALRCDLDERDHLFHLAGLTPPSRRAGRHIRPGLISLADHLTDVPVCICTDLNEVLWQNRLADSALGPMDPRAGRPRNFTWRWFTDPATRRRFPEEGWPRQSTGHVNDLRATYSRRGGDADVAALVRDLVDGSAEFRALWEKQLTKTDRRTTVSFRTGVLRRKPRRNHVVDEIEFDVIVCGAGAAGSTVAGKLAENEDLRVLLIEAGPDDEDQRVSDPDRWPENLGTERDWGFVTEPNPHVDNRRLLYSMGKGLGGGSSINVGVWSRGHRQDWEDFAKECGDPRWNHDSVLDAYRELETWRGDPDPARRGVAGPMHVQPAQPLHPFFSAMLDGAETLGLDRYGSPNGELAERGSGCAVRDEIVDNGTRRSPFRAFVTPRLWQRNLTVLTGTLVTRVVFEGHRAVGVEAVAGGQTLRFRAAHEVVLGLGAVQTPKILMQSGIGPARHLESFGIDVLADSPGVGANLDDHLMFGCVWETTAQELPPPPRAQAVCFWGGDESPKFVMYSGAAAFMSPEAQARYGNPHPAFTFLLGMRLRSRGSVRLTGPAPTDAPAIETGYFDDPADLRDAVEAYRFAEAITHTDAMHPYRGAGVLPGTATDDEVATYLRSAASTFWHQCGTARAGTVVDSELHVRGVDNLRVADASVLPRVTSGNTMAPCVVIGYRAAQLIG